MASCSLISHTDSAEKRSVSSSQSPQGRGSLPRSLRKSAAAPVASLLQSKRKGAIAMRKSVCLIVIAALSVASSTTGCKSGAGWTMPGSSLVGLGKKKPSTSSIAGTRSTPQPPSVNVPPYPAGTSTTGDSYANRSAQGPRMAQVAIPIQRRRSRRCIRVLTARAARIQPRRTTHKTVSTRLQLRRRRRPIRLMPVVAVPTALSTPPANGSSYGTASTPNYGAATPNYGTTTPSYGSSTPSYGARATTPNYGTTTPSYGAATPSYGATTPNYGATTPNYGATTPSYGNSSNGTPGSGATGYGTTPTAPSYGTPGTGSYPTAPTGAGSYPTTPPATSGFPTGATSYGSSPGATSSYSTPPSSSYGTPSTYGASPNTSSSSYGTATYGSGSVKPPAMDSSYSATGGTFRPGSTNRNSGLIGGSQDIQPAGFSGGTNGSYPTTTGSTGNSSYPSTYNR